MPSIIRATTTSGLQVAPDNSGSLQLQTNGTTTAVTIDTSQNVVIGTTSTPTSKFGVAGDGIVSNGGNVADAGGSIGFAANGVNYNAMSSIKGLLANSSGTEDQGGLGFLTRPVGAAGQSLTERMRIDSSGNFTAVIPSGSTRYPAFWCRAWVNFNGTGTVAIRASGNVTSITDNGTGQYTLNFTNSMPDANYSVVGSAGDGNNAIGDRQLSTYPVNTSSCKVVSGTTASVNVYDAAQVHVAIFR